jgi:hypothetical protein
MMLSVMTVMHEQVHQRAQKNEEQWRDCGKMRPVPKGQIDRASRDKAKNCQPLRVCEAAEHVSPSPSDEEH